MKQSFTTAERNLVAFEAMLHSYIQSKNYNSVQYMVDAEDLKIHIHIMIDGNRSGSNIYITRDMDLYRVFERTIDFIESKVTSKRPFYDLLNDNTDALSYSYSYMKPIAEGCTCKATKNGLEISGQLTDNGKMFLNCDRRSGKTLFTSEFLNKQFHIPPFVRKPEIKDVIFNSPATIVFWTDGTKTVVKCQKGDVFDPEKGLAMAITKKALGNKGNYYNTFNKYLPNYYKSIFPVLRKGIKSLNKIFGIKDGD